jgi:hypothetical protein
MGIVSRIVYGPFHADAAKVQRRPVVVRV